MSEVVRTEKHRIQRAFFDHASGRVYPSIAAIPGRRELDQRSLPIFLRIGYVPGNATLFKGVDCLPGGCSIRVHDAGWSVEDRFRFRDHAAPEELSKMAESDLQERAGKLLVEAVQRCINGTDVVVPLSGGLDSRAILGALLETMPAHKIHTYTYGLPGTLDFEIGSRVAHLAGTRHVRMDLRRYEYSSRRVGRTAVLTDANTELVKPSVWTHVLDEFGDGVQYWTGFTGDGVSGSHYLPDAGDVTAAVRDYVEGETRALQYLEPSEWTAENVWPVARETKYDELLSRHEAVWFENHVERYTAHHIFLGGLRYAVPFMDDAFAGFMLAIPARFRRGKKLFNQMVTDRFRSLFSLPSKDYGYTLTGRRFRHAAWRVHQSARKVLWRIVPNGVSHPRTSYVDFAAAVRERKDVRDMVTDAMSSLARRRILDAQRLQRVLEDHVRGARDTSALLTLFTSLEIAMQTLCDTDASTKGAPPL